MSDLTRRETLGALAVAGVALAATRGECEPVIAPVIAPAPAYAGAHTVKPLPFDPAALPGLSERLLRSHHENNYGGALKRLNAIEQQLGAQAADAPPFAWGSLKREEAIARNSVVLHELYFANLGGSGAASGSVESAIAAEYGSLAAWESDFRRTALALGGGAGWVVLGYDAASERVHDWWGWDHLHQAAATTPLLVLDMYEHSYALDYGANAKGYVDAFLANAQWGEVNRRLAQTAK
jgi:Fe-Mn family superoxide dismutase